MTLEQAVARGVADVWEGNSHEEATKVILRHIRPVIAHNTGLADLYRGGIITRDEEIAQLRERIATVEYRLSELEGRPMLPIMEPQK